MILVSKFNSLKSLLYNLICQIVELSNHIFTVYFLCCHIIFVCKTLIIKYILTYELLRF